MWLLRSKYFRSLLESFATTADHTVNQPLLCSFMQLLDIFSTCFSFLIGQGRFHKVYCTFCCPVLCFLIPTDMPPKVITGTVALQVGDVNDNCPTLTSHVEYICSDTTVVNVTAVDEDGHPNAAPFNFSLVSDESEWRVEPLNGMIQFLFLSVHIVLSSNGLTLINLRRK